MKKFTTYTGTTVPIMNDNIDTDIIIPKNYLKSVSKTGFGDYAFDPWRYNEDRTINTDFSINKDQYKNAKILITGDNFGCGSSREHAAWALQDYGFHVIIAGGYSDIFYNNWLNNGHLPIILSEEYRKELSSLSPEIEVTIDLENQIIKYNGKSIPFDISDMWKERLINGQDSIDVTLKNIDKIEEYEKKFF
ncbi:3-isopropylmalate dehydratase small subunit [Peptostreptococcus porci]|uniref:3-isopropylmalate dehydratase small subunit n=1 Tax=Peptostreptococcus porci TaxID=2652282 RepID=UPI0023F16707|nr:3-isopropylmalate dehydratase small subunit [Peptostreptococcus porci]MDD7182143.1 3-isopropylmalate dehydratase small subunit [Peptostreptococcus porci]MDY5965236.1 3-isopropylmalate dehydratase small subunit [Peptostreptococcus porci]MDY6232873.1 3-isopropylmalate dehydratase small subunit [Peptostreptococcus porci]